ncbi:MAG: hypothetical protein J6C99_05105 [Lachnospiraceae bacterium]|nr:hypothetical protein [Lachnospiraceae bacterium]
MKDIQTVFSEDDKMMVAIVKAISERGSHAEVKRDRAGNWIIYEVNKKKRVVG